jgi:hypothetical protein
MKNFTLIFILLVSINLFSQNESKKLSKSISLIESVEYSFPKDSILFYYGGHSEFSKYFDLLSKILKKKMKKIESNNSNYHLIDLSPNVEIGVESFDEINATLNNPKFKSICLFYIGKNSRQTKFDPERVVYHQLFIKVIDVSKNNIMLMKRFKIESQNNMTTNINQTCKYILKELKLLD